MAEQKIRFDDGAGYERFMGVWSRLAGEVFLDWLAPPAGLRWIDIGCGNGSFTELLVERCAPSEIHGIDPSEAQLAFARMRPAARIAQFAEGSAMALPFSENRFDAAVMALVIFFLPEPEQGVAEMARVVGPGGTVAAYAWDIEGGGFPGEPLNAELRAVGITPPMAPSVAASRIEALRDLWVGAGIEAVETRQITVSRTFADFDDLWAATLSGPTSGSIIRAMEAGDAERLKVRLEARLPPDAAGRITYAASANAIKGRTPN